MNHWPFIIAAYGLSLAGVIAMTWWSLAAMRSAERDAEALRRER